MIVTDARVMAFAEERLGESFSPPGSCMGLERDGKIVAAAVFTFFTGPNIDVSVAGSGWTRGFAREVGRYVFCQLGCLRMTVRTEQTDVVRYAVRLGGRIEGVLRDFFGPGRDAVLVGILRRDWKLKGLADG